jgi:hypothetical protein
MQRLLTVKRHFTIALWIPVRRSASALAFLNGYRHVSRRALNLVEDILSTYEYYKWTLSAITYELNVSRHMLIWTFLLVSVCGTRSQSLHLSVTPCITTEIGRIGKEAFVVRSVITAFAQKD